MAWKQKRANSSDQVSSLKRTRLDLVLCSVNFGLIPHLIQKAQIDDIQ